MASKGCGLGPLLRAFMALAAAGCHSTSAEAVLSQASTDFMCAEPKVHVTPTKDKSAFVAEGCGKSATYTCEGWDNANQAPICTPKR